MSRLKLVAIAILAALVLAGGAVAQQTSTAVQKVEVEIIHVSGNNVVFMEGDKVLSRTVPADFRVDVGGKMVPVSELVPGQKVTLERTTTTVTIPPTKVTKVRNGEVVNVSGRTLLYREDGKQKTVVVPSDYKFIVDGKPVPLQDLKKGMKLTATLVTETEGVSTSAREVKASAAAPKAPEPAAPVAAAPAPPPPPPPAPEPAKEEPKKLPKTASPLPLAGLAGGALLALGAGLSALRRRLH